MINFSLSSVEHEKSLMTSGPDDHIEFSYFRYENEVSLFETKFGTKTSDARARLVLQIRFKSVQVVRCSVSVTRF